MTAHGPGAAARTSRGVTTGHIIRVSGRTSGNMTANRWGAIGTVPLLLVLALAGCERSETARTAPAVPPPAPEAREPSRNLESSSGHDLSADEAMGGHTLVRHIGKTDDELRDRLRREPDISSASTYTDRTTAETVVGAALSAAPRSFDSWRRRTGRRPNFVLHFSADRVIGRSMRRGQLEAMPCRDALVVVRWDDRRQRFYVLTSYPEERR